MMIDDIPKQSINRRGTLFEEQEDNSEVKNIYPTVINYKLINYLRLRSINPSHLIILY